MEAKGLSRLLGEESACLAQLSEATALRDPIALDDAIRRAHRLQPGGTPEAVTAIAALKMARRTAELLGRYALEPPGGWAGGRGLRNGYR
jgi:hypothetical protein